MTKQRSEVRISELTKQRLALLQEKWQLPTRAATLDRVVEKAIEREQPIQTDTVTVGASHTVVAKGFVETPAITPPKPAVEQPAQPRGLKFARPTSSLPPPPSNPTVKKTSTRGEG